MVIYSIDKLPKSLTIGRQTETGVTQIGFDCAEWLSKWSNLALSVMVTPPNGDAAYPASTQMNGSVLVWTVNESDTVQKGKGTVEILGIANGVRKLSAIVNITIQPTTTVTTSEPPEGVKPWIDDVIRKVIDADEAVAKAERASEIALSIASDMDCATPAVVSSASGNAIVVSDSADRKLRSLTIYGRTTQTGTPTPSTPRPLVTVGADGDVAVTAAGKNLANITYGAKMPSVNSGIDVAVSGWSSDYIYTGGRNVCLSKDDASSEDTIYLLLYDESKNYIGYGSTPVAGAYINAKTITGNERASYCRVRMDAGSDSAVKLQLEFGESVTDYTPYVGSTATIATPDGLPGVPVTEGGNYTDESGQQWIADTIEYDADTGMEKLIRRIERLEFDGSEAYQELNGYFRISHSGLKAGGAGLCSIGSVYSSFAANGFYYNATFVYFRFDSLLVNGENMTVAELKEWVAAHPFVLYAVLAEPVEMRLSAEEATKIAALMTHYPNTTVYNDDGAHMSVEYVADMKLYVDKMIGVIANGTY